VTNHTTFARASTLHHEALGTMTCAPPPTATSTSPVSSMMNARAPSNELDARYRDLTGRVLRPDFRRSQAMAITC
jgi:hypothetical protein